MISVQIFPEGEVNSGSFIPRREALRYTAISKKTLLEFGQKAEAKTER